MIPIVIRDVTVSFPSGRTSGQKQKCTDEMRNKDWKNGKAVRKNVISKNKRVSYIAQV